MRLNFFCSSYQLLDEGINSPKKVSLLSKVKELMEKTGKVNVIAAGAISFGVGSALAMSAGLTAGVFVSFGCTVAAKKAHAYFQAKKEAEILLRQQLQRDLAWEKVDHNFEIEESFAFYIDPNFDDSADNIQELKSKKIEIIAGLGALAGIGALGGAIFGAGLTLLTSRVLLTVIGGAIVGASVTTLVHLPHAIKQWRTLELDLSSSKKEFTQLFCSCLLKPKTR